MSDELTKIYKYDFDDEKLIIKLEYLQDYLVGIDVQYNKYGNLINSMLGNFTLFQYDSVEIVQNSPTSFTVKTSRIVEGNYSETCEWIWTKLD